MVAVHNEIQIQFIAVSQTPGVSVVLFKLATLMVRGELSVAVDRTHDFADAATAQRAVIEEGVVGRILHEP